MDMDALTTAVFVLGMEKGARLLQRLNAQAVFIDTDRNVYVTKGLKEKFTLSGRETARHERSA
jgi:thiamine biosynthesis lipoprotein